VSLLVVSVEEVLLEESVDSVSKIMNSCRWIIGCSSLHITLIHCSVSWLCNGEWLSCVCGIDAAEFQVYSTTSDSLSFKPNVLLRLKYSSYNNCSSQEVNKRHIPSYRQCEFGIESTFWYCPGLQREFSVQCESVFYRNSCLHIHTSRSDNISW
jgi:hypothetical protein